MCDIDFDGDRPTLFNESRRTARKEYVCDSCHGTIRPGTLYGRVFSVVDGYASTEKSCTACVAISDDFKKDHHGQTGFPSYMTELLTECVDLERDHNGPKAPAAKKWVKALGEMKRRKTLRMKKVAESQPVK